MIQDETQPPFPEKPKEVSTTTTTVETKIIGKPRPEESTFLGASGRFWITLVLCVGLILIGTIGALGAMGIVAPRGGATQDVPAFVNIFTAYIGVAGIAIGTYLGQKTQSSSK